MIVVDVRNYLGALRIFENEGSKFVAGVGSEEAGKMVMIPWTSTWWYQTIGSLRVGYIVKKVSAASTCRGLT